MQAQNTILSVKQAKRELILRQSRTLVYKKIASAALAAFFLTFAYGCSGEVPVQNADEGVRTYVFAQAVTTDPERERVTDETLGQESQDDDVSGESPDEQSGNLPDEPDEQNDEPGEDGFITVRKTQTDIHNGSLLLINHDHPYDIPEETDFVYVSIHMTMMYRLRSGSIMVCSSIMEPLNDMMAAFYEHSGRDTVTVISAFRDHTRQQEILDQYIRQMGRQEALRWAAEPGHSEHHTGLAVDFGVTYNRTIGTFTGTGAYSWFSENAHNFGFILRYPENKTAITKTAHEPWHFRFVGTPHSQLMHQSKFSLEEYIAFLSDTSPENSHFASFGDDEKVFEIYFTPDPDILIPAGRPYTISGNNIDGFIVTIEHEKMPEETDLYLISPA